MILPLGFLCGVILGLIMRKISHAIEKKYKDVPAPIVAMMIAWPIIIFFVVVVIISILWWH